MGPLSPAYGSERLTAAAESGSEESVLVGEFLLAHRRVAVLAWEFGYLGGSVGVHAASLIVSAIRRATAESLPLLTLTRSGGTRMQEGAPAFVQMVAIAAALADHGAAGLPHLVHLCGPTTGGVLATIGSAGDFTSAEPGAFVGFLGPRAVAAITGHELPAGVQSAQNLVDHAVIDAVLDWPALRATWSTLLGLWAQGVAARGPAAEEGGRGRSASPTPPARTPAVATAPATAPPGRTPRAPAPPTRMDPARQAPAEGQTSADRPADAGALWAMVRDTRRADRPGPAAFVAAHMTDLVVLPGTTQAEGANGALVGVGRWGDAPVVVAATVDRTCGAPIDVGALRTLRRGIGLAARWGLPIVTLVDTNGAELSVPAEEAGIAGQISRVMLDLVRAPVPTVALLLGEGTGGAALALLGTDRIVAASHAWVSPLAPEGAAAIRHAGSHDPAEIAWSQRIGVHALADVGFIDRIVTETPGWEAVAATLVGQMIDEVRAGIDPGRRRQRYLSWQT